MSLYRLQGSIISTLSHGSNTLQASALQIPLPRFLTGMGRVTWTDIGLIILAIILPPLAVFLKSEEFGKGESCHRLLLTVLHCQSTVMADHGCSADFVLNCLLSIFGWLPGQIHAIFYIVTTNSVCFRRQQPPAGFSGRRH